MDMSLGEPDPDSALGRAKAAFYERLNRDRIEAGAMEPFLRKRGLPTDFSLTEPEASRLRALGINPSSFEKRFNANFDPRALEGKNPFSSSEAMRMADQGKDTPRARQALFEVVVGIFRRATTEKKEPKK
jgi:hypothetical protein